MNARDDYPTVALGQANDEIKALLGELDTLRQERSTFRMYLDAQKRYQELTGHVFRYLVNGDVHGLIDYTLHTAEGCDYVDDDLIELARKALDRWPILDDIPDDELPGMWTYSDFTGGAE